MRQYSTQQSTWFWMCSCKNIGFWLYEISRFKQLIDISRWSPEQFYESPIITQKVDIYAIGITFYKLITHKYPVNESTFEQQQMKIAQMNGIEKPPKILDSLLWDLLSKLLEFDPDKRITAAEALQHPYFVSPEAIADISKEQQDLASLAAAAELEGDSNITEIFK
ncbi:MAG: hypothetical protein EZS28_032443 [Streblomastix strix]|uniref:Protein kinase domain-containing protein n=1 Tax=Streblomastix strix TaxID=222440 RepID=A0A5J4UNI1_9EUKA|nr:MAG: hypothetical protein EZS28_032443 [Streblomastix strix]